MAPGLLAEPPVEGTEKRIEVISVNGHKVDPAMPNGNAAAIDKASQDQPQVAAVLEGSSSSEAPGTPKETPAEQPADKSAGETPDGEAQDQTMKCEIKLLDRRVGDDDEYYFCERKMEVEKPKQVDWWKLYAFCVVRNYVNQETYDSTGLYVNPQPLRQLLYDFLGDFPQDPVDLEDQYIESPYRPLFHCFKEIEEEGTKRFAEDPESLSQLRLLLSWISTHFASDLAAYDRCWSQKVIAFDQAWTIFKPGTIVYCKLLGQNRAFRVEKYYYNTCSNGSSLILSSEYVDFDGERLGLRCIDLSIPGYKGLAQINELPCVPLAMLDDADDVREELLARGRKFEGLVDQHFMRYEGIAVKKTTQGYVRFTVNGRVMIDCKTYFRLEPNEAFTCHDLDTEKDKMERSLKRGHGGFAFAGTKRVQPKLTDEQAMLANAAVRGYSFTVKKFLEFFVDDLEEIEWNTNCFDGLVLDAGVKRTVQALVSTHSQAREAMDDIVKGKGMGLVCVLHGPPGVGKTLTAECVAEYVKRPLYMVSSGDLGTCSAELDRNLTRIMDMTSTWRAVLLIDEADVFLERRSLHDLHRNAMVSVFLRVLEYYSGILFLTTNRVTAFDDAFKSRIHIPIRYTDLTTESRRAIWRNFCNLVPGGVDIDDKGLDKLAESDLNGRQIKNAVKAAESLAAFEGRKVDLEQLLQVTKIQALFESDLSSLSGVDYTAPGSSKRDADSRNMFL
ncbi:hypothetical protein VTJ83DRAFT_152 [Remersonia thermophila]|uniref:AAA+ ATPase domain-containing protein n=1 Tax=Remersonia thermophila TaxID=72144 RepID=A0ABR4DK75_9PEZI